MGPIILVALDAPGVLILLQHFEVFGMLYGIVQREHFGSADDAFMTRQTKFRGGILGDHKLLGGGIGSSSLDVLFGVGMAVLALEGGVFALLPFGKAGPEISAFVLMAFLAGLGSLENDGEGHTLLKGSAPIMSKLSKGFGNNR
jgi:hypothetical protein